MRLDAVPIRRFARRIGRAAPFVALLLMFASPAVLARTVDEADQLHHAAIAECLKAVPDIVGTWAGSDVRVPTEAEEILRPNAILSRRFSKIGSPETVVLAIVHCSDVRDMDGHYPPRCYPANGWENDEAGSVVVHLGGSGAEGIPLRYYRFTRADRGGALRVMCVLNAFVLPDGELATEADTLERRAVKKAISRLGIAQIQLVFETDTDPDTCARIACELLSELPESVRGQLGLSSLGAPPTEGDPDPETTPKDEKEPRHG